MTAYPVAFTGYVVSDCGAIGDIYQGHKAAKDAQDGVSKAVRAGTDLDCGLEYENIGRYTNCGKYRRSFS